MKIAIYPIVSPLHDAAAIDGQTLALIHELKRYGDFDLVVTSLDELYNADLSLILVQSGGSEGKFLHIKARLKAPYYLLTYGTNNSLAASMEILSFLKNNGEKAEILHGSAEYIAGRLKDLGHPLKKEFVNLGVIGKPSDWLIASHVDKKQCLERLNVHLIDIDIEELISLYGQADARDFSHREKLIFDENELTQSKKVTISLEKLVQKYHLNGLTLRCFDLLGRIHTTGCLGLSLLNKEGIIGSCEGDVPAMLSMHLLKEITGQCGFQANPSRIDAEKNTIILAHCSVPLNMPVQYTLTTHFESGIGVAIKGELQKTEVTLFKLSNDLKHFYAEEGTIIETPNDPNLCRTQIKVQLEDVRYFLVSPYGNHHIVVYGRHKAELKKYLEKIL